ncbi:MAG: hypothetical protein FJX74_17585 [Armatimonadetes bacterium]|nr:hypothetical protein [Armatimonadota bacterium]
MDEGPLHEPTGAPPPIPPPLPPPPMAGWGPQPEDPRLRAAWTKTIIALVLAPVSLIARNVLAVPAVVLAILALVDIRRIENPPSHYLPLAIVALVIASLGVLLMLGSGIFFLVMYLGQGTWP